MKLALRDLVPSMSATSGIICFHQLPQPSKGATATCPRCDQSFVAKKVRPPREEGGRCWDCGHVTPRGPKRPKRWTWVRQDPYEVGVATTDPSLVVPYVTPEMIPYVRDVLA
ncbi:MAG: hypothetical protein JWO62_2624 [Acidimicrobiaceae bacterium]|nr:hypothetical protein [Acidimicrobiaceae bacterium]